MRAYLDTNVLIDYCWSVLLSEKERKTNSVTLINKGSMGEFEIFISFYTIMELHEHMSDFFLQQNIMKSGFSYREFSKNKKDFVLDEHQLTLVSELVENFRDNQYLNYIVPEIMTDRFFNEVMKYVRGYIEFVDALHLRTAIDTSCEYFVTKDGPLRKRAQKLKSDKKIIENIKITSVTGFLDTLRNHMKKEEQKTTQTTES